MIQMLHSTEDRGQTPPELHRRWIKHSKALWCSKSCRDDDTLYPRKQQCERTKTKGNGPQMYGKIRTPRPLVRTVHLYDAHM